MGKTKSVELVKALTYGLQWLKSLPTHEFVNDHIC